MEVFGSFDLWESVFEPDVVKQRADAAKAAEKEREREKAAVDRQEKRSALFSGTPLGSTVADKKAATKADIQQKLLDKVAEGASANIVRLVVEQVGKGLQMAEQRAYNALLESKGLSVSDADEVQLRLPLDRLKHGKASKLLSLASILGIASIDTLSEAVQTALEEAQCRLLGLMVMMINAASLG